MAGELLVYLNRLSDFLFVAARAVNRREGVEEPRWASPRGARRADGVGRYAVAATGASARAASRSNSTVSSQPMQASVIETP